MELFILIAAPFFIMGFIMFFNWGIIYENNTNK